MQPRIHINHLFSTPAPLQTRRRKPIKRTLKLEVINEEDIDVDVNIEKVVLANVSYKYTNYSDKRLDDSELVPTDEYYISIDGKWYYGWGLEINSEVSEQVVE